MTGIVIALLLWLAGGTWIASGLGRFLAETDQEPDRDAPTLDEQLAHLPHVHQFLDGGAIDRACTVPRGPNGGNPSPRCQR